ncbi:MAG: ABC transporter permease [Candidatus Woesearchaeota archaeon]
MIVHYRKIKEDKGLMFLRKSWLKFKKDVFIIKTLALNEFKLRYLNAKFGYFWLVISPLVMLLALYIVFSKAVHIEVPHYQFFLLLGIVIWNFFSEATLQGMNSLINNKGVLNSISISKHYLVIASFIASLLSFFINLGIFFLFEMVIGIAFKLSHLLFALTILECALLVLGISFILSVAYPLSRDVAHLWNIFITISFWVSPIVYRETQIPKQYLRYYMLNPIARIVNEARDILIYDYVPSIKQIFITIAIVLIIFIFGLIYFNKKVDKVVEAL